MKIQASILSLLIFMASSAAAAPDPEIQNLSENLSNNTQIESCYLRSRYGDNDDPVTIGIIVHLAQNGSPTQLFGLKSQSKDWELKNCIKDVLRTMKFQELAKHRSEFRVDLSFPTKA